MTIIAFIVVVVLVWSFPRLFRQYIQYIDARAQKQQQEKTEKIYKERIEQRVVVSNEQTDYICYQIPIIRTAAMDDIEDILMLNLDYIPSINPTQKDEDMKIRFRIHTPSYMPGTKENVDLFHEIKQKHDYTALPKQLFVHTPEEVQHMIDQKVCAVWIYEVVYTSEGIICIGFPLCKEDDDNESIPHKPIRVLELV